MSKDDAVEIEAIAEAHLSSFEEKIEHDCGHSYWRFGKISRRWMIEEKQRTDRRPAQFTWAKKNQ